MASGRGTLNKVMLIGRLGQDPELRYTSGGQAVANLRMATNSVWKGKDGQTQDQTEWHTVVLWNRPAEIANEYLKKGSRVYIEGNLRTRSWDDKDGVKRYTTEVYADRMEFLDSKNDGGSQQSSSQQSSSPPQPSPPNSVMDEAPNEDDLPF